MKKVASHATQAGIQRKGNLAPGALPYLAHQPGKQQQHQHTVVVPAVPQEAVGQEGSEQGDVPVGLLHLHLAQLHFDGLQGKSAPMGPSLGDPCQPLSSGPGQLCPGEGPQGTAFGQPLRSNAPRRPGPARAPLQLRGPMKGDLPHQVQKCPTR